MISNKIATKQCFPILHNPNKNLWNDLFDSYYYASKRDNKIKRVRKAWEFEIDGRGSIANDLYTIEWFRAMAFQFRSTFYESVYKRKVIPF